jgi:hypothetical protein
MPRIIFFEFGFMKGQAPSTARRENLVVSVDSAFKERIKRIASQLNGATVSDIARIGISEKLDELERALARGQSFTVHRPFGTLQQITANN